MLILWKNKQRDNSSGFAISFLRQMEDILGECLDKNIKVISNAGGLNPKGLANKISEISNKLGLNPKIAYIQGDDVLNQLNNIESTGYIIKNIDTGQPLINSGVIPVTANAYLGAWGIVEALKRGADIVICPRITDASLVVGPSAWAFDWSRNDFDKIAGAIVAGHILECGAQATGGNFSYFKEITDSIHPGFPIAIMEPNGSCIITKHPGTGGMVTVETVTAQLLYEIDKPAYLNPDAIAHFDTINLEQIGSDKVRVSGVKGSAPPETAKVAINYIGGYRNSVTFMLTGLDIEEKAKFAEEGLWFELGGKGQFSKVDVRLIRSDRENADKNEEAVARLIITVCDPDESKVGRNFFDAATSLGLSSYPGLFMERANRQASQYGVYWPIIIPASFIDYTVHILNGEEYKINYPPENTTDVNAMIKYEEPESLSKKILDVDEISSLGYIIWSSIW